MGTMKKILAVLLLLTASPLMAEEEECLYDQDEQRAKHLELQKKVSRQPVPGG